MATTCISSTSASDTRRSGAGFGAETQHQMALSIRIAKMSQSYAPLAMEFRRQRRNGSRLRRCHIENGQIKRKVYERAPDRPRKDAKGEGEIRAERLACVNRLSPMDGVVESMAD